MVVVMVVKEGLSLAGVEFEGRASMRVRRRKHVCKVGEGIVFCALSTVVWTNSKIQTVVHRAVVSFGGVQQ
jgi:hypothetical protein